MCAIAIAGWINISKNGNNTSLLYPLMAGAGSFLFGMGLLISFGMPDFPGNKYQWYSLDSYTIEKTEYRVIVKVRGQELEYKDAYTVKNVDKIKRVGMGIYYNAWGIERKRNFELIFEEGKNNK